MIGWLIAVAVIVSLAFLPLGAGISYDQRGPMAWLMAGPFRFSLYPGKKKEKQETGKTQQKSGKLGKKAESHSKPAGGGLAQFMPLVTAILDLLDELRWKLRVKRLDFKLIMAGDDPCDLAVNYGKAWAAIGNLFPVLERSLVIKKRNVEVECDFTADKTLVTARVELTITVVRLLRLCGAHGFRVLQEYIKIFKSKEGGASK